MAKIPDRREMETRHSKDFSSLFARVERWGGIDLRALAAFRMALAAIVLSDMAVRAMALSAHYTDAGVLPREVFFEHFPYSWAFSLHLLSGARWVQAVLFVGHVVAAVAVFVGYRTRWATALLWALTLSLHVRNPVVLNAGDWLLLNLLLWSLFLPLGARFSLDALARPAPASTTYCFSVASFGILLQMCFIYWFSVIFKSYEAWGIDRTALHYALNLDRLLRPAGKLLLAAPDTLLQAMSWGTYWLEMIGPLLPFVPLWNPFWRTTTVLVFICFHAGLAAVFTIGLFPFVCMAGWLLFLPAEWWDRGRSFWRHDAVRKVVVRYAPLGRRIAPHRAGDFQPGGGTSLRVQLVAALLLFYILSANLLTAHRMTQAYYESVFARLEPFGDALRIVQRWNMFSPAPPVRDGWYVMEGRCADGRLLDLFRDMPVSWERPRDIASTYKNERWRKYLEWVMDRSAVWAPDVSGYMQRFGAGACGSVPLASFRLIFMEEQLRKDLTSTAVVARILDVRADNVAPMQKGK
jgi:hypothetical protein